MARSLGTLVREAPENFMRLAWGGRGPTRLGARGWSDSEGRVGLAQLWTVWEEQ